MTFNVLTLFPDFFRTPLAVGVTGQALTRGDVKLNVISPRDFATDVHRTVDDRPFGGGDGMVMMVEPLKKALESVTDAGPVVYLSPHGATWSDALARTWARERSRVTLVCGRYGGIDQRFINQYVDEEISVGDFVLSGGEPAALVVMDSVIRLLPGVLGNALSSEHESFAEGLLESPQYTRPRTLNEGDAPEVLIGGHHARIQNWRHTVSLLITALRRPDLIRAGKFEDALQKALLQGRKFTQHEWTAIGLKPEEIRRLYEEEL